jgi:hypothetical protein
MGKYAEKDISWKIETNLRRYYYNGFDSSTYLYWIKLVQDVVYKREFHVGVEPYAVSCRHNRVGI